MKSIIGTGGTETHKCGVFREDKIKFWKLIWWGNTNMEEQWDIGRSKWEGQSTHFDKETLEN